jgi:large conductance mechanosensitive channel
MKKLYEEFKEFAFRGDIIGLAVAFVMAVAFTAVINSLVDNIIVPIVNLIFGGTNWDGWVWHVRDAAFYYGSFLTALVSFIAMALAVFFFVVKPYQAYQNMRKSGGEAEEAPSPEDERVALLREIRDALNR